MPKNYSHLAKIPLSAKAFFSYEQSKNLSANILLLADDEQEACKLYQQLLFYSAKHDDIFYLPSLDISPYDRLSPSSEIAIKRAKVLSDLALKRSSSIIVTKAINILSPLPLPVLMANNCLQLEVGQALIAKNLLDYLTENGYVRSPTATSSGEFTSRGEIVDIVLADKAYRINFAWQQIETIKIFDVDTQISAASCFTKLDLYPASEVGLNKLNIANFKVNYLRNFGVSLKSQHNIAANTTSLPLYQAITQQIKFPGYENLLPLFYQETCYLPDYLAKPTIIYDNFCLQAIAEHISSTADLYQARKDANIVTPANYYPALPPDKICLAYDYIKNLLSSQPHRLLSGENADFAANIDLNIDLMTDLASSSNSADLPKKPAIDQILAITSKNRHKAVVVCYSSNSNLERLKNLMTLSQHHLRTIHCLAEAEIGTINFARAPLTQSFATANYLFFAENLLLPAKFIAKPKTTQKLKNILTELDNIGEGELVVHNMHGIGQFLQVETIQVGGKPHDCLKILYAENTKLYIPVENIDVLKKYGSGHAELDKLGHASWQRRKAKLKERIGNIAKELLRLAASRQAFVSPATKIKLDLYEKFCHKFAFVETEDQLAAIDDIKADLTSEKLMDRLICGDVGYGKTEVAMRAAFMVASDNENNLPRAQVAVIAPTTILGKQHYLRFFERFTPFGFEVVQLSRLTGASTATKTKQAIKNGAAQVIIGTHALLAKNLEFANLKMVIIDEEQHFGVAQKERLKELKSGAHILSLSATPIPRTLQMSMVGLKDLSLIATPPLDRLPVRTSVMPYDGVIVREALLREHKRGGKSFYVCPRISDILEVEKKLKQLVPELKYMVAHGQLPPAKVDEIMTDFYEGKFDILLSTTIIESGIDVASANTIIVHHADKLGLSQLYQLRGRVGRGKIRGYAYLTISSKISTKVASRRLEIMQNVDSLGAGFTIASHDMDLRGFGNLVGDEQSGHVKEVGVELYQEMLDEAISDLRSEQFAKQEPLEKKLKKNFAPSINLGLPVFIAAEYISDSSLRLALYRRLGDLKNATEVEDFKDEMIDRFGIIPLEFNNLLEIVKIKQLCSNHYIESIDSGAQGFIIKFKNEAANAEMIFNFVQKYPHHTKLKPDNKLVVMRELTQANTLIEINKFFSELYKSNN